MPDPDKMHLLSFRKTGGSEDPPDVKAKQRALSHGHPTEAAEELLQMQKSTLLGTKGAVVSFIMLETPDGQCMVGPGFGENIVQLARKAAAYAKEMQATRVSASCATWLVPTDMPEPYGGRRWRKAHRRGRKPGLVAFCADRTRGVASLYAQAHENAKGRPVGFSEVGFGLKPELAPETLALMLLPSVTPGLPQSKVNFTLIK